jgi:hypothetical protein
MTGVLAMTMVVRDEEEILDRHAGTGAVRWWREDERAHVQSDRVSRLLAIARDEHDAAWVIQTTRPGRSAS